MSDSLVRLQKARTEIREVADVLFFGRTSKREDRRDLARRLNAVAASLRTVELREEER